MFTPPPSPLPLPRIIVTDDVPALINEDQEVKTSNMNVEKGLLAVPSSGISMHSSQRVAMELAEERCQEKRRTARRIRWGVLVVPIILIFVALTSKRISVLQNFDDASLNLPRRVANTDMGRPSIAGHEWIHHQHRRQEATQLSEASVQSTEIIATSVSATGSQTDTPTSTTSVPQTEQTIPPVPDSSNLPTLPTPFPQPYDTLGVASGVKTQGCQTFFQNMTQSEAFRTCRPFSLLFQYSTEFIEQAQTNLSALNTLLWGTCNTTPSFSTCTANLEWFASSLKSSCSTELNDQISMVTNTLLGLEAYPLLRSAGCLVNQKTNTYCYAQAMHSESPADTYLYNVPLGTAWPSSATPSCSTCANGLLDLYAETLKAGNDSASGLENTYENAAEAAVATCGNGYAEVNVATSGTVSVMFGKDTWRKGASLLMSTAIVALLL